MRYSRGFASGEFKLVFDPDEEDEEENATAVEPAGGGDGICIELYPGTVEFRGRPVFDRREYRHLRPLTRQASH